MRLVTLALVVVASAGSAAASSPDAWTAFRAETAKRCLALARQQGMKTPKVIVHPWGSSGHGIAVLLEGADKRICLMDKRTKAVDLTPGS